MFKKIRFNTLSFIFIILYVNIFQKIFGAENSIVGVIFTIMMSASMVRDLTATPLKHLLVQAAVLVWMAFAACLVNVCPAPLSFLVNFATLLLILYAFTYEYSSHIYFPYILSYLFLVFLSPVAPERLPKRMLGMLAGAVSIMLYQWFMGRHRVRETAKDVLTEMVDDVSLSVSFRLKGSGEEPDLSDFHGKLSHLSRTVYDRRKKVLCISDAGFSMVDGGRGLEHLLILLHELPDDSSHQVRDLLSAIAAQLKVFRSFLQQETGELPPLELSDLPSGGDEKRARLFWHALGYTRDRLLHMTDPQKKFHYRKTALSLKVRLQAALDLSPVRAVYALRTALLLSCATLLVQRLGLPHGKWFLFTLASVSLPYADEVPGKIKKRVAATLLGGLVSVVCYALFSSPAARTVVMMLSGYVSFYFSDYTETFACSTVGALGGAVFANAFGFSAVGHIALIRLGYILAGAVAGYAANCLLFPYKRAEATKQLWRKYRSVTALLTDICRADQVDTQLYYSLVIQAYLLEEKLAENAELEQWDSFPEFFRECRERVFMAHRRMIAERMDAPVFEAGHLQ